MNPRLHTPCISLRSLKTRFAIRFLRNLKKISNHKSTPPPTTSSGKEVRRRYQMVKVAADASMASAVGSRRAWSRAVIMKLRWRTRASMMSIRGKKIRKKKAVGEEKKTQMSELLSGQEEQLRKMVPGGEAMDTCSLLDETAHYIRCLTAQVMVMRKIAGRYSA